jgi:hypothetical protein
MMSHKLLSLVLSLLVRSINAQAIVNGQIYTPGIALVDAPQPNTPLGGGNLNLHSVITSPSLTLVDTLHVALDVTSNGQLQLPPYPSNPTSAIHNITIFLSSYTTGKNFTVSNGTAGAGNASLGEIMQLEPSSTVKHVNWIWPDCLVGDGAPDGSNSSRGAYNVCCYWLPLFALKLILADFHTPEFSIKWHRYVHHLRPTDQNYEQNICGCESTIL